MKRARLLSLTWLLGATSLWANDAYIPEPGTGSFYPMASVQWAQDFWFDDNPATLPGYLTQVTANFDGEYGLTQDLAADFSVGFSTVNYKGGSLAGIKLIQDGITTRNGTTDSKIGVSWRLMDEFTSISESAPTLTFRVGGILEGTYDTGFINAVGDGASGFEAGVRFGKVFIPHNAGIYGSVDYRWLNTSTPDEWEASVGAFKTMGGFTFSAGMREKQSVGGIDILGPGFSLDRFPDVREKNLTAEVGATWQRTESSSWSVGYVRTLDGENTPKKNVLVAAMSIQF